MTVKDLRELLADEPDDMRVVVSGYEGGYDDVATPKILEVVATESAHYYGEYSEAGSRDTDRVRAILLPRPNTIL